MVIDEDRLTSREPKVEADPSPEVAFAGPGVVDDEYEAEMDVDDGTVQKDRCYGKKETVDVRELRCEFSLLGIEDMMKLEPVRIETASCHGLPLTLLAGCPFRVIHRDRVSTFGVGGTNFTSSDSRAGSSQQLRHLQHPSKRRELPRPRRAPTIGGGTKRDSLGGFLLAMAVSGRAAGYLGAVSFVTEPAAVAGDEATACCRRSLGPGGTGVAFGFRRPERVFLSISVCGSLDCVCACTILHTLRLCID